MTWFNAVPAKVLDLWIALEEVRSEEKGGGGKKQMGTADAYQALAGQYG